MATQTTRPAPAPSTSAQRLINLAAKLGLQPVLQDVYRGKYRIALNGTGEFAGFGVIEVGAKSGRVLWGTIYRGNYDPRLGGTSRQPGRDRATGYRGALGELKAYARYAQIDLAALRRHGLNP